MSPAISQIKRPGQPRQDLDDHLKLLFTYCEGYVPVRLLRETGTQDAKPVSRYLAADTSLASRVWDLVDLAEKDQRGLYVVPCTVRKPGSAKADEIYQTCVIPVDLDTGDIAAKRAHLEHHLGTASMVVCSGGQTGAGQAKLHLYWKLTEACSGKDLDRIAELRGLLIDAVGADPSFRRLTQPIRVPGSIHGKNGIRSRVAIEVSMDREHELDELLERARRIPRMPGQSLHIDCGNPGTAGPTIAELQKTRVRSGAQNELTRYEALSRIIGHWLRQARLGSVTLENAWEAVADHNQACIDPPWPEARLRQEFEALLRKDRKANPESWGASQHDATSSEDSPLDPPHGSEDALAQRFVAEFGPEWRHVSLWGTWLHWDGRKWSTDETLLALHHIRTLVRTVARQLQAREARKLATSRTFNAVERIASSDPRVATHPSDWDSHVSLLNTPSSVLDLGSGEMFDHDPALLLTQSTTVSPGGECPTWTRFLDDITGGDADLGAYLARICGYCLTGDTREQVFFFFHGAGANGKSVFLQTVSKVLGSYAATAPLDSFMIGRGSSHPTDLAGLRGKRLVTVSETEPGRAWAESRIKTITGGDPIRARLLYRDFFEFTPTFKLIVAGNHRPQLTGVGEAMRRRLHLVPFDVTIPQGKRDRTLAQRLERELGGILQWMLDGHSDWKKNGLAPPERIREASQAYFADEDLVGQWIDETCELGINLTASARALFTSWGAWAEANGVDRGSQKTLGEALRSRGFKNARSRAGWYWRGLSIRRGSPGDAQ